MIKDYSADIYIINGTTNELIKVDKISNRDIFVNMTLNDYLIYLAIKREFQRCDSVTISKSYMKS